MKHETSELDSGERLLARVAFDLEPGSYTATVVVKEGTPHPFAMAVLDVPKKGSIRVRNSWQTLFYLYQASMNLDGGYLAIARTERSTARPSQVWVWQVLADILIPASQVVARHVIDKVFTTTAFPCDDSLIVEAAWPPGERT